MSGLEAFSIACSVMQTVSFAKEVYTGCKAFYDNKPADLDALEKYAKGMAGLVQGLLPYVNSTVTSPPQDELNRSLASAALECQEISSQLEDQLRYVLTETKKGRKWAQAVSKYVRQRRRKDVMAALEQRLARCQSLLDSLIASKHFRQSDAILLRQSENFNNLSQSFQGLLIKIADGHAEMSQLTTSHHRAIMEHVSSEVAKIDLSVNKVSESLQTQKEKEIAQKLAEELLRSLRFGDMHTREVQIQDRPGVVFDEEFFGLSGMNSVKSSAGEVETEPRDLRSYHQDLGAHSEKRGHILSTEWSHSPNAISEEASKSWSMFVSWLQSDHRLFWINGLPGAGKSTLVNFLVHHYRTRDLLNEWAKDTRIVSYYFWRVGSLMQTSTKGFLCSILHQILSMEPRLCASMLDRFPQTKSLQKYSDWSQKILKDVLWNVLSPGLFKSNICIFIDGLDEIADHEELSQMLHLIQDLYQLSNVKLCLSSRPEWIIKEKFNSYPQLALHTLTASSMYKYASQELTGSLNESFNCPLCNFNLLAELIHKAEGVFLWLSLVVANIKRSLAHVDSAEEVMNRVSQLPAKLKSLYKLMWERLGDDDHFYLKTASQYIRILLTHLNMKKSRGVLYYNNRLSTLCLLLAQYPEKLEDFMYARSPTEIDGLSQWCEQKLTEVAVRCVGFIVEIDSDKPWRCAIQLPSGLAKIRLTEVDFVHRSAYDFFVETEDGKQILSDDSTGDADYALRIAAAYATISAFWGSLSMFSHYRVHIEHSIFALSFAFSERLVGLSPIESAISLCEDIWSLSGNAKSDLLWCMALTKPTYKYLITRRLPKNKMEATEVLRGVWDNHLCKPGLSMSTFVEEMLKLGAEIDQEGFSTIFPHTFCWPFACFNTPFASFLAAFYEWTVFVGNVGGNFLEADFTTWEDNLHALLTLLKSKPVLHKRTAFWFTSGSKAVSVRVHLSMNHTFEGYPGEIFYWIVSASVMRLCNEVLKIGERHFQNRESPLIKEVRRELWESGVVEQENLLETKAMDMKITAVIHRDKRLNITKVNHASRVAFDQEVVNLLLPSASSGGRKPNAAFDHRSFRECQRKGLERYLEAEGNIDGWKDLDVKGFIDTVNEHLGMVPPEQREISRPPDVLSYVVQDQNGLNDRVQFIRPSDPKVKILGERPRKLLQAQYERWHKEHDTPELETINPWGKYMARRYISDTNSDEESSEATSDKD